MRFNSPEVSLFLKDMYDEAYLPKMVDSPEKTVFGCVLKREEEDPYVFSPYREILNTYTRAEIKKFFGYSLGEYLELTLPEAEELIEQSERMKAEMEKIMEEAKKDTEKEIKKDKKIYSSNPYDADDLHNILTGEED